MNMNKKFLKHYMETEPEGTSKKYIFLVDNQDIAMNIVMSGYQALYLGQEDDEYYFSVNSFIEDMRSISLQDLNKRSYAIGMYGKLLNACADIPCKAMNTTDVLKKAVGEDTYFMIFHNDSNHAVAIFLGTSF